jgi:hypothetical protein
MEKYNFTVSYTIFGTVELKADSLEKALAQLLWPATFKLKVNTSQGGRVEDSKDHTIDVADWEVNEITDEDGEDLIKPTMTKLSVPPADVARQMKEDDKQ